MTASYMTPEQLLAHWQGHRALTRRVIETFPEEQLFAHSVGGMRPFAALTQEFFSMAVPMVAGVVTGTWQTDKPATLTTKEAILARWDEDTAQLDALFAQIPPEKFQETMTAFGQFTSKLYDLLLYVVDNEIHHRGQGYVYLRSLGIEPPPFWER